MCILSYHSYNTNYFTYIIIYIYIYIYLFVIHKPRRFVIKFELPVIGNSSYNVALIDCIGYKLFFFTK